MPKCVLHPGRNSVSTVAGKNYCQQCGDGQRAAAAQVALTNVHVEPKACFVTFRGGDSWVALTGTGCAHWVSHQKSISAGSPSNQCLEGRTIRVPDAVAGRQRIALENVQAGDMWANVALSHMGLVSGVVRPTGGGAAQIQITHDSSHLGRVSTNDFSTYFHGEGNFYR